MRVSEMDRPYTSPVKGFAKCVRTQMEIGLLQARKINARDFT
jgi:hypothetical protein